VAALDLQGNVAAQLLAGGGVHPKH
jgi:hypothetical protein